MFSIISRVGRTLRTASLAAVLSIAAPVGSSSLAAQNPVTAGAVSVAAKSILSKLQDVVTTLTGNAQIAAGAAAGQLSDLIHQFDELTKNNIADPLQNLSANMRILGEQLQQVTDAYGVLVRRERACIFEHLDLFVAGLNTVTANIKSGIPLVSAGTPRIIKFIVAGMQTPNVIPSAGGRVTVKGFRLWEQPKVAPEISIALANGTVVARPVPRVGASADEVAFNLDPLLVRQWAGECVELTVRTFKRGKVFLFLPGGRKQTAQLGYPMCIPEDFVRTIVLQANVAYSVTGSGERALSSKRFGWGNDACEQRKNFGTTMAWDAEIPDGWRIVRVHQSGADVRNQTHIGVSFGEKTVSAAGWLDQASCVWTPFGSKLLHDTHWFMDLTPVIAGPVTRESNGQATTDHTPMTPAQTRICARVPKDVAARGVSTAWVEITSQIRGLPMPAPLYASPRMTNPDASTLTHTDQLGGYSIVTRYNPTVVDGLCEVCVTLSPQNGCGW